MLYRQSTGLWHSRDVDFRRVAMFLYTIGDLIAFILSIVFVIILLSGPVSASCLFCGAADISRDIT